MNARALAVVKVFRSALAAADRLDPAERDAVYHALVVDLRSRRPGPPTEPIRDPRGPRGGR